jgi:hypothetical protein
MKVNDQILVRVKCRFLYYIDETPDKRKTVEIILYENLNNTRMRRDIEDILFYSLPPLAVEHIYNIEGHLLFKCIPDSLELTIIRDNEFY